MSEPTSPATGEQTCTVGANHQAYLISWAVGTTQCFRWANGLPPYDTVPLPVPPLDCYTGAVPSSPFTHWCPNLTDFGGSTGEVIWYDDTNVVDPGPTFGKVCDEKTVSFVCLPGGLAQPKSGFWTCLCAICLPGDPHYNSSDHLCHVCDPTFEFWCDITVECESPTYPPCFAELTCDWNNTTCVWDCDPPTCAPGDHWSWEDCECVGDCPDGYQWCDLTSGCERTDPPPCYKELNCQWSSKDCTWHCNDPSTICGSRTWDPVKCNCGGAEAPDNFHHTSHGEYYEAYRSDSGIVVRRSETSYPPYSSTVTSTGQSDDFHPSVKLGEWQNIILVFRRPSGTTGIYRQTSSDDAETWTDPVNMLPDGDPLHHIQKGINGDSGMEVIGSIQSDGTVQFIRRFTGETSWETPFTAQLYTVGVLGNLMLQPGLGGSLSVAPDGPRRWSLVATKQGESTVSLWVSTDDCETWRKMNSDGSLV